MGLGDLLGKVANKTGQFIKETSTQMGHQAKLSDYKRQMLNQLSTDELRHLCNHFAIEPQPPMDMTVGMLGETARKRPKFVPVRDDYIRTLMNKLKANDIIDWCRSQRNRRVESIIAGRAAYMKKHNIDERGAKKAEEIEQAESFQSSSAPLEEVKSQKQPSAAVTEVIERIENMPVPYNFPNEERAHYFLFGKLDEWFPNRVQDEANRKEIDILIDGKIGIEVKNFVNLNPEAEITRLMGQISRYAHKYESYVVVIFGGAEAHKNEIMRLAHADNVEVVIK